MIGGKSTEKLAMIIDVIRELPQEKLKSVAIDWKVLDSEETADAMWCPCLFVELYEENRPEGVQIEIKDATGQFGTAGTASPPDELEEEDGLPGD